MHKGILFNQENVEIARQNIKKMDWAQAQYVALLHDTARILNMPDETIYNCVIRMQDESFAYGISGCPHCGKPFSLDPEEQCKVFSPFEEWQEKQVTCLSCKMIFPNHKYPDTGTGIELNSKGFYLVGMWNFYYASELLGGVRHHEGLVTKLTYLYMFTGEQKYAAKAIVILDAFSAIFPYTNGPRDFTPFGSDFLIGRVHLLTSIVHRIKVWLASAYDWLCDNALLNEESPALKRINQSGTIKENIENMLNDYMLTEAGGPEYDLRDGNLTNLQNHEADGIRAMLAVGLALDNQAYCEWGKQAIEALFYNTIGRDGMYYEGSYSYASFTATVFLDIALLGVKASTKKELHHFHPFSSKRLFKCCVENTLNMFCHGRLPSYGDSGKDVKATMHHDENTLVDIYRAALFFYQYSPDQSIKQRAQQILGALYSKVKEKIGTKGIDLFFRHVMSNTDEVHLPTKSTFMGQAGIGILRDRNETTLLMRIGQNTTHSHDDALGIKYFAKGKEISADIGYSVYGTNGHYGWNSKAIAHHTVVVNEDETLKQNQLYKPFSGGEWLTIYEDNKLHVMEGSARELYEIEDYRRLVAVVPLNDDLSYSVDFFYIKGGKTADYSLHAFHENSELQLENASCKRKNQCWTLAGLSEQGAYYDQPNKSFGERLTTGETFNEIFPGEKAQGWTPNKNNGYGFIHHLQEYETTDPVLHANWTSEQGFRFHWSGVIEPGNRIFSGLGPSLEGEIQHPFLVIRNSDKETCFASMFYTSVKEEPRQLTMKKIGVKNPGVQAVSVLLPTGEIDYWVYCDREQIIDIPLANGIWQIDGRIAWIRVDAHGKVVDSACINAKRITYQDNNIEAGDSHQLFVDSVDINNQTIVVEGDMPKQPPRFLTVHSRMSNRQALYPIHTITERDELMAITLADSIILSKGKVVHMQGNVLSTSYPLPLGWDYKRTSSPFTGKMIISENGGTAIITKILNLKTIEVEGVTNFRDGEKFSIIDIQKGDSIQWM